MKKKLYLVRHSDGFRLAKGEDFIFCEGLALVREFNDPHDEKPKGMFALLDVESGLYVYWSMSKKKVIELWNERKETCIPAIKNARSLERYKQRVAEMELARSSWRKCGYEV